jgi:uncharacterized protein YggU (UPF0235/DUF167 family)
MIARDYPLAASRFDISIVTGAVSRCKVVRVARGLPQLLGRIIREIAGRPGW